MTARSKTSPIPGIIPIISTASTIDSKSSFGRSRPRTCFINFSFFLSDQSFLAKILFIALFFSFSMSESPLSKSAPNMAAPRPMKGSASSNFCFNPSSYFLKRYPASLACISASSKDISSRCPSQCCL